MAGRFSCDGWLYGQAFTKLEVNVAELSVQGYFVLEFRKVSPFL